jgi:hypothetical protein
LATKFHFTTKYAVEQKCRGAAVQAAFCRKDRFRGRTAFDSRGDISRENEQQKAKRSPLHGCSYNVKRNITGKKQISFSFGLSLVCLGWSFVCSGWTFICFGWPFDSFSWSFVRFGLICFLFCKMLRNIFSNVCFYFCSMELNS